MIDGIKLKLSPLELVSGNIRSQEPSWNTFHSEIVRPDPLKVGSLKERRNVLSDFFLFI